MKKMILMAALVSSLLFTNCGKKSEEPAPVVDTFPVADANGVVERFTFDTNLNGTRRTGVSFTNVSATNLATVTGTDRTNTANRALLVPQGGAVQITGLPLPTGNAARTISCWVHLNGVTNIGRQFISYGTNAAGQTFGLSYNAATAGSIGVPPTSNRFLAYTWGNGNDATQNFITSSTTGVCGWVHLVAVYTGGTDNKVRLYVNGTLTEITPLSTINTTGTNLVIGGFIDSTPSSTSSFRIDDVIIYNRALTQQEVNTLAADGQPNCI